MLIKRGPGAGRKSSQSYDDDSSSQARGSQIQAGNGIVTHRIKIGLVMNSSSTASAEVGLRLVTTPQKIVPLRGAPTTGAPEPALLYVGNGKHRFANVHRDAIATLYALGVRTAPAGSYYLGANAHSPTMTELATAASRSRGGDA